MRLVWIICAALVVTACGPAGSPGPAGPAGFILVSGNHLAYEHGIGGWAVQTAYREAAARCEVRGMLTRSIGTSCPLRCVTNFECVKP